MNVTLMTRIKSAVDNVEKFVFKLTDGAVVELTAINKGDGKWSICAPSQTGCNMLCKFCVMTELKIRCRNLTIDEIVDSVTYVEAAAAASEDKLLISFMGAGEPTLNAENLVVAMTILRARLSAKYAGQVRFAIATILPTAKHFMTFADLVASECLDVKVHLSLHATSNTLRKTLIPGSSVPVVHCLDLLGRYRDLTDNKVEVHYTLITGVNDFDDDCETLAALLLFEELPVCLLRFNDGVDPSLRKAEDARYRDFEFRLRHAGLSAHSYTPPGTDIGASCGQFLKEYYQK